MGDLISRQAALNSVGYCGMCWQNIHDLPSAESERKKGKWLPMYEGQFTGGAFWFECSDCGRVVPNVMNGGWGFCPNCGADMRGERHEAD